jgi:hypothetical protein
VVAGLSCCTSEISVPFRAGTPESYCALAHLEWSLLCHHLAISIAATHRITGEASVAVTVRIQIVELVNHSSCVLRNMTFSSGGTSEWYMMMVNFPSKLRTGRRRDSSRSAIVGKTMATRLKRPEARSASMRMHFPKLVGALRIKFFPTAEC